MNQNSLFPNSTCMHPQNHHHSYDSEHCQPFLHPLHPQPQANSWNRTQWPVQERVVPTLSWWLPFGKHVEIYMMDKYFETSLLILLPNEQSNGLRNTCRSQAKYWFVQLQDISEEGTFVLISLSCFSIFIMRIIIVLNGGSRDLEKLVLGAWSCVPGNDKGSVFCLPWEGALQIKAMRTTWTVLLITSEQWYYLPIPWAWKPLPLPSTVFSQGLWRLGSIPSSLGKFMVQEESCLLGGGVGGGDKR